MDLLHQSIQKQLNTIQTTPSIISSKIASDSPERPKVQTPVWVAESKVTGEKTLQKFHSKTKHFDLEGKVSYNSFDINIELIDGF